jgi:hypothetical protein
MRKKWTPNTEITDSLLKFREKRKWQIALRRYVLEKNKSSYYAPFFGIDSANFRKWIELQFLKDMNWDNFSLLWQFDHIVPVNYFDFTNEKDLRLCWNFLNIRAERIGDNEYQMGHIDILSAKSHFHSLYQETGYPPCLAYVQKITAFELSDIQTIGHQIQFLNQNKDLIEIMTQLESEDFDKINEGLPISEILAKKEIIKNFGSL